MHGLCAYESFIHLAQGVWKSRTFDLMYCVHFVFDAI